MKNPIEELNELHKSRKMERLSVILMVLTIAIIGISVSVYGSLLLNDRSILTVGRVTKVSPTTIYYEFILDGPKHTGAYDFSRGNHLQRKNGDLLLIQVSAKKPRFSMVLNKKENINNKRDFGELVEDIKPVEVVWWQLN